MTTLINKILAIFQLKLVSTKPANLVEETVKFLNTIPKSALGDGDMTGYVGDVDYVVDKITGKPYIHYQVLGMDDKYYDFDGNTYTAEEMREKLTN